jgi:aerobic-type carbon monoxide dehydrogenase small subunit (CoxS/CutS family)
MIQAAAGLLARQPDPTDAQIRQALRTSICRCGIYNRIVDAVRMAAQRGA